MSQRELIDAYQKGELDSWTCVRRLLKKGVPLAAALSLLLGAPGVAYADDDSDDCQTGPNVVAGTLDGDDCDDDGDDDGGGGGDGDNLIPPNVNIPPNINVP